MTTIQTTLTLTLNLRDTMKKAIKFIAAALCFAAALSCTKEVSENEKAPVKETDVVSFTANAPAQTKVTLDALQIKWETTDQIAVAPPDRTYWANYVKPFDNISDAAGVSATFSGTPYESTSKYFAVYPYNEVWFRSSSGWAGSFSNSQAVPANGVDKSHLVMTAQTAENSSSLDFAARVALLKFTIGQDGIKQMKIKMNNNAIISSYPTWNDVYFYDNGTHYISQSADSRYCVMTVSPSGTTTFTNGASYYVAMIPGTYTGGMSVTFVDSDDKVAAKTSTSDITLSAGKVRNAGTISGLSFSEASVITTEYPLGEYNGLSSGYPLSSPLDGSIDLGANVSISGGGSLVWSTSVDGLSVTSAGVVTASKFAEGAVTVSSSIDPTVFKIIYVSFKGVKVDDIYYTLDAYNSYAIVTSASYSDSNMGSVSNSYSGSVTIPASITVGGTEYPVKSIGTNAFAGSTSLTSVTLPEGITTINTGVCDGCTSLETFNIPSTVNSMPDVSSNSAFANCSNLTITSASTSFPVDAYGNLYEKRYSTQYKLMWLCEKTTGDNVIMDGTVSIGSGNGALYSSKATTIKFPASLNEYIWVNSFWGSFPNLTTFIVDFTTYDAFNTVFQYYKSDSSYSTANLFANTTRFPNGIKLSVPAAAVAEYSTAVADYGFTEVITH